MNAAGDHRARLGDPLDLAKEIHRRAADRREQDLEVGTGNQFGEHAPGFLEQGTAKIGLSDAEARGHSRQMPDRIDGHLGDADLAAVEQHPAVGSQPPLGQKRAELRRGETCRGDRHRRTRVDARPDVFGKDLADQVTPRVERHDLGRIGPLRARCDQRRGCGVGEVRAVVARQPPRRHGKGAIDRIGAGIRADRVALP